MRLDAGLFKLDFEDHHAILGIPITADARAVRKRYLTIARKLHPDSLSGLSEADAQQANELLSKWVNPAYEALNQEKCFTEHQLMLKLKGQGLKRSPTPPETSCEVAQTLLQAPQVELAYQEAVKTLAEQQFAELAEVLTRIGQLSELNMIYLYRTSDGPAASARPAPPPPSAATTPPPAAGTPPAAPSPPPRRTQAAILESYMKRAQEFETSRDYGRAVLEMREALKTYPNSARCHSYLASLYLKSGQATMAKVHTKRALDLHPEDEIAQSIQAKLEKSTPSPGPSSSAKPTDRGKAPAKGKPEDKGGFFGGLFGGKKK